METKTLRQAYGHALSLTVGVLKFHASNIIRSTRTWWVVAGIVSAVFVVVDAEQFGYTLGSAILPMLAIGGCVNLYYRVRRTLLTRKRSRKFVGQITLTVTVGQ